MKRYIFKLLVFITMFSKDLQSAHSSANFRMYIPQEWKGPSNILYLYAHGFGATQRQSHMYLPNLHSCGVINEPLVLFNFPDAKGDNLEYYADKVNLGQTLDMKRLAWSFDQAESKRSPNEVFICMGLSRGAATLINYCATQKCPPIAALVLESPFDTFETMFFHLLKRFHLGWVPYFKNVILKLVSLHFPLLKLDGICPLRVIHKIPHTIPIILFHSQKDKTVPINSSRILYKALLQAGHQKVHLIELPGGSHGKLLLSEYAQLYTNALHAFYKNYDLAYQEDAAMQGEDSFSVSQPTLEEIDRRIAAAC